MRRLLPLLVLLRFRSPRRPSPTVARLRPAGRRAPRRPGRTSRSSFRVGGRGRSRRTTSDRPASDSSLPSGMLSADGRVFVSAVQRQRNDPFRALRHAHGPRASGSNGSGCLERCRSLGGRPQDRALQVPEARRATVLTLDEPGRSSSVRLPGTYELESLSQDGRRLFLVHWHRSGSYDLQQYDRVERTPEPDPARRAGREDERPGGRARSRPATDRGCTRCTGSWTAAPSSTRSTCAPGSRTASTSRCVATSPLLGATALTLSPDERRLYLD